MWIICREEDGAVVGTITVKPPEGAYGKGHIVKEWFGSEPRVHDPEKGVESYDPTIDCPGYNEAIAARLDCQDLHDKIQTELDWLNETIPAIANPVIKRLAQQNRAIIKALRYIILKQGGID
jgi:hypothetical protein